MNSNNTNEEFTICEDCKNPLENCICVCPFCGERDKCECGLKLSNDDGAATGGWLHNLALLIFSCSLDYVWLLILVG